MFARLVSAICCVALSPIFVFADTITSVVPLQAKGHSFSVEVIINGNVKTRMLVDNGSSLTIITKKLADKLMLSDIGNAPRYPFETPAGISWGKLVILDKVKVGKAEITNVEAAIFPRPPNGAEGILGLSFLSNLVYEINGPKAKLTLKIPDEKGKLHGARGEKWWRAKFGRVVERISRFKSYRDALDRSIKGRRQGIEQLTGADIDGIVGFYKKVLARLTVEAEALGVPNSWQTY